MENTTKSKIALGLILGVAAGAAVYYFMTNENGKHQLADAIDALKDFSNKAKETAINQSGKLAEKTSEVSSKVFSKAQDLASKLAAELKNNAEAMS
jgi:lipopolysaccharide export system protein LptC